MENKMETTIMGYIVIRLRVCDSGFKIWRLGLGVSGMGLGV